MVGSAPANWWPQMSMLLQVHTRLDVASESTSEIESEMGLEERPGKRSSSHSMGCESPTSYLTCRQPRCLFVRFDAYVLQNQAHMFC